MGAMSATSHSAVQSGDGRIVPSHGNGWLKPFEKGRSGNPTGRPKGGSPREALRSFAAKKRDAIKPQTVAEEIALTLLDKARSDADRDTVPAAKLVIDNVDGPLEAVTAREPIPVQPVVIVVNGAPLHELDGEDWGAAARAYLASLPSAANGG